MEVSYIKYTNELIEMTKSQCTIYDEVLDNIKKNIDKIKCGR